MKDNDLEKLIKSQREFLQIVTQCMQNVGEIARMIHIGQVKQLSDVYNGLISIIKDYNEAVDKLVKEEAGEFKEEVSEDGEKTLH